MVDNPYDPRDKTYTTGDSWWIRSNSDTEPQKIGTQWPKESTLQDVLNSLKDDPIQYTPNLVHRSHGPERPIYLQFDTNDLKVFEEDAFGSRILRFTINYSKINSILMMNNNTFITPKEIELLDVNTELRNTQASLYETSMQLRDAKNNIDAKKDSEIALLHSHLNHATREKEVLEKEARRLEHTIVSLQDELKKIQEDINNRKRAIEHLEII